MAVREDKDRRVGIRSEKLLTLEEAARRLGIPADDVEAMVRKGEIASFRLGGALLRVRLQDVEAIQVRRQSTSNSIRSNHEPSLRDRVIEFIYFNDFYILALLVILILVAIILLL